MVKTVRYTNSSINNTLTNTALTYYNVNSGCILEVTGSAEIWLGRWRCGRTCSRLRLKVESEITNGIVIIAITKVSQKDCMNFKQYFICLCVYKHWVDSFHIWQRDLLIPGSNVINFVVQGFLMAHLKFLLPRSNFIN